jgi:putative FmdB family regulatory protein
MKILFDFECKDCGVFDKIIEYTTTTDCPTCGKESKKLISAPNIMLEGVSGDFPDAHAKWAKKHHALNKQHGQ